MQSKLALVSTYPPRRCGLATFSAHLRRGLLAVGARSVPVIAVTKEESAAEKAPEVLFHIRQEHEADYREAARVLAAAGVDAVLLQHEFGIFGGAAGTMVQEFLRRVQVPVIATLHTILSEPAPDYREALLELLDRVGHVVVMAARGAELLQEVYGVAPERIHLIPHGVPDPPAGSAAAWKERLGLNGRTVAMTFGLIGPGKGIETALQAVAGALPSCPDLLFLVAGATHPEVLRREGERYRRSLETLTGELGLSRHVQFVDRYLEEEELLGFLKACDFYLTPYPGSQQITSGTLTYALAMGKPVISTPFAHAQELLADGAGRLVPFGDAAAMARAVAELAKNPGLRAAMGARARERTRGFGWKQVAARYLDLAVRAGRHHRAVDGAAEAPREAAAP